MPNTIRPSVVKEQNRSEQWEDSAGDFRALSIAKPAGVYSLLQKGGDPAAGSPTATLLRLRPSH